MRTGPRYWDRQAPAANASMATAAARQLRLATGALLRAPSEAPRSPPQWIPFQAPLGEIRPAPQVSISALTIAARSPTRIQMPWARVCLPAQKGDLLSP